MVTTQIISFIHNYEGGVGIGLMLLYLRIPGDHVIIIPLPYLPLFIFT